MESGINRRANRLFKGIATRYDLLSEIFSFFQTRLWRRFLVARLNARPGQTVLDLCTGTAGVAMQIAGACNTRVVGVDLSPEMLQQAKEKLSNQKLKGSVTLVTGRAEELGFADRSFDAVCFTYLMRYVEDPRATLKEIVRVLRPGGSLVSLEFGVPKNLFTRALWLAYTRVAMPLATGIISPGWRRLGSFLGPSITGFYRSYPLEQIRDMWIDLGISDVQVKSLSLGGAVVMWGTKNGPGADSK